jgi:hypothetical protein
MRTLFGAAAALLVLGAFLVGCNQANQAPFEITGPNQVILEVPGMT